jgi:NDP-sugar pyrophosphorylase family protein/tRNA A-37 threonylcarbamoyl transferase component Bud32
MTEQITNSPENNSQKINAMILAAGAGTRLRPFTETIPKPLIPVCNYPLLELIIAKLKAANIDKFAVNTHYLAEKIAEFKDKNEFTDDLIVFHEPEILGTGGPLVNARSLLAEGRYILLHNGDILTDLDFRKLIDFHIHNEQNIHPASLIATMVLIDGPENKVLVAQDSSTPECGTVLDILNRLKPERDSDNCVKLTYTGIMILSPEIFDYLPKQPERYSIIDAVLKAMSAKPGSVSGYIPETLYWNDLGTPKQLFKAHEDILVHQNPPLSAIIPDRKEDRGQLPILITDSKCVSAQSRLEGFVVAGKRCIIEDHTRISNCILLDDVKIEKHDFRYDEIIGKDVSVHRDIDELKQLNILSSYSEPLRISSLKQQASDRRFYRITYADTSKVLMLSSEKDSDFNRFIDLGRYFHSLGLPTPEIFASDETEFSVLMEDLGNDLIYQLIVDNDESIDILQLYHRIIDQLIEFQYRATQALNENPGKIRIFDYDYLRWETSYFKENFLEAYCKVDSEQTAVLETCFHKLAQTVLRHPQIVIHRDFQSQNILLNNNQIRFVDYQGSRIGSYTYDLMALVRDPYIEIKSDIRALLLDHYFENSKLNDIFPSSEKTISREAFRKAAIESGLQRNMQALGAYGFLSLKKGKKEYLQYIPLALKYLKEGVNEYLSMDDPDISLNELANILDNLP